MSLRIGIDLDGVLADMQAALRREAELLFGPRPQPPDSQTEASAEELAETAAVAADEGDAPPELTDVPTDRQPLTIRQQRKLWKHVARVEGFWEGLEEIEPGAVARLASLATEHGWNVIFLTQRPETAGDTAQRQTQRWLQQRGFDLPSVFIVPGYARGRVADALSLDVVIDDRPSNCIEIAVDSKARPLLIWRDRTSVPPNVKPMGIVVVETVMEALDALGASAGTGERRGVVARLKSLFL